MIYYVPEQTRMGSGSTQSIVAQGEPVREGQKLMRIPDLTKMMVGRVVVDTFNCTPYRESTSPFVRPDSRTFLRDNSVARALSLANLQTRVTRRGDHWWVPPQYQRPLPQD